MALKKKCLLCSHEINPPVCTNCLLKKIDNTLKIFGISKHNRDSVIESMNKKISFNDLNTKKCMICNKNEISLCGYCFIFTINKTLIEYNFPNDFIGHFNRYINFIKCL